MDEGYEEMESKQFSMVFLWKNGLKAHHILCVNAFAFTFNVVGFQPAEVGGRLTQAASLRAVTWAYEWWPLAFPSAADFQFRPLAALYALPKTV